MISVTFTVDAFDRITAVTLRGHAKSVKQGIDPLCAAVTGIMTYTVNTLKEVKCLSPYVSAKDPGDLTIRIEEAQADAAQVNVSVGNVRVAPSDSEETEGASRYAEELIMPAGSEYVLVNGIADAESLLP